LVGRLTGEQVLNSSLPPGLLERCDHNGFAPAFDDRLPSCCSGCGTWNLSSVCWKPSMKACLLGRDHEMTMGINHRTTGILLATAGIQDSSAAGGSLEPLE
jgi:hypothetical protein